MNIGKAKNKPKYVCDKCKQVIPYVYRKGFAVNKFYKQEKYNYSLKIDFHLCDNCTKKLKEWLFTRDNEYQQNILNRFSIWEEDKQ